jgi:hypothetical protein
VAGVVGLELRNVGANYPFEKSRRFPAIQPNLVTGDGSRLSACQKSDSCTAANKSRGCDVLFNHLVGAGEQRRSPAASPAAVLMQVFVKGEGFAVDASVMEADASRYHGKAPGEIDWSAAGNVLGASAITAARLA